VPPVQDPGRAATVRQALSVGIATGLYGVSLGALAVAAGLSVLEACLTSLLLFSGGSQFALVGVIGGGGSAVSAVASSSLLAVRNAIYGPAVKPFLHVRGLRRVVAAQLTIDESSLVGVAQPTPERARLGFWLTGASVFVAWNAMTLVGALAGSAIGDPRTYGLDAAAAAAFLGLLWPRVQSREPIGLAVAAAVVAAALVPVVPAGVPVLAAAAVAVVAGVLRR
jgi:predicted branched-subunit amino acid permease